MRCENCNRTIAPEDALYCGVCGKAYCRECSDSGLCRCLGELKYRN